MSQRIEHNDPALLAAFVVFCLPALALTSAIGLGLVQLVILISTAWFARKGLSAFFVGNFRTCAWVYAGFIGYFLDSLVRMLLSQRGAALIDGPSRLVFALSCIVFVGFLRPKIRWFWLGVCVGALGAGVLALVQRFGLGVDRVAGYTHHAITFGDLSLALGLMALCGLSALRKTRLALLPVAALMAGMLASILSGSRGGWIALLFAAVPFLRYGRAIHGKVIVYACGFALALFALAYAVPGSGVAARVAAATSDVRLYVDRGDATTSVGIRLELWKASWLMFSEHPLLGVGRDQFYPGLQVLAQQGKIQHSPALTYSSSHNDALHFLATGGLFDFSFLLMMYFAPLAFFVSVLRQTGAAHAPGQQNQSNQSNQAAALAGAVLVMCFIGFGLTDVMFWLMMPKVFYAMMVCTLIGFCLEAKEIDDK